MAHQASYHQHIVQRLRGWVLPLLVPLLIPLFTFLIFSNSAHAQQIAPGWVLGEQKISNTAGGYSGAHSAGAEFGAGVEGIGDLDGDGVNDIVVGATRDASGTTIWSAIYVLFMNVDGTVKSEVQIDTPLASSGSGFSKAFGDDIANLGDIDGDGVTDIAVAMSNHSTGAVWIYFLNSDGTMKANQQIASGVGGLGAISGSVWGKAVESLGDLDGDGITDIAVFQRNYGTSHGGVWIVFLNSDGTVKSTTTISQGEGGFTDTLKPNSHWGFGYAIANMGDLDGDGVVDLAVSDPTFDNIYTQGGRIWLLYMNTDGTVKSHTRLSDSIPTALFSNNSGFGYGLASLGDLDGDDIVDIAVSRDDNVGGYPLFIFFLNADGTVKSDYVNIGNGQSGFVGPVTFAANFAENLANIGDLNGDRIPDLVASETGNTDGTGANSGAVHILFMDGVIKGNGVTGRVFEDSNNNGAIDNGESSIGGIVVTAMDASGTVTSTVTNAGGFYFFDAEETGITNTVQIEFSLPTDGSLDAYRSTVFGPNSLTSVQQTRIGGDLWKVVNAGFRQVGAPNCAVPTVALACNSPGTSGNSAGFLSFPQTDNLLTAVGNGSAAEIGAVWGSAVDTIRGDLYTAALLKRHAGLGPLAARNSNDVTVDGVYRIGVAGGAGSIDPANPGFTLHGVTPASGPQIDLGSVRRDLDDNGLLDNDYELLDGQSEETMLNVDLDAFAKIGTVGFGNIDINTDDYSLWLVNLNQRSLIRVERQSTPLPSDGSAVSGTLVDHYPIPDPGCSGGDFRPFALTFSGGVGYVGVTCSAETSQSAADLAAYILSFAPGNMGAGFTTEFTLPLTFAREMPYVHWPVVGLDVGTWRPWTNTWPGVKRTHAQPILSDIKFDGSGDMVLGFMDRWSQQTRDDNLEAKPLAQNPAKLHVVSAGDLIHVCRENGGWVLEGTGDCIAAVDDLGNQIFPGGAGGPSGGEYYSWDGAGACVDHLFYGETATGSLCMLPGGNNFLATVIAPFGEGSLPSSGPDPDLAHTNGIRAFNTTSGFQGSGAGMLGPVAMGLPLGLGCSGDTASSLGEIACFCPAPPQEIGNRVWLDGNLNGIQDGGETSIGGVTVELLDGSGSVIASAITDARGGFYFSNGAGADKANAKYNLTIPAETLTLRIANVAGQAALNNLFLAPADQGTSDQLDSDATMNSGHAVIPVSVGPGIADHTFDFGFMPDPTSFTVEPVPTTAIGAIAPGGTINCGMDINNPSAGPIDNMVFSFDIAAGTTLSDTNWTPANLAGPGTATLTLNGGDELPAGGLPPGGTVSIAATLVVDNPLPDPTNVSCAMVLDSFTDASGAPVTPANPPPTPTDPIVVTSTPLYDLALRKTVGKDVVVENEEVTFTIDVFNQGNVDATNVVIVDRYPTGFSLTAGQPDWTGAGGTEATYTIASLLAGESVSIPIVLTAGAADPNPVGNAAEIQTDDGDDVDSDPEDDDQNGDGDTFKEDIVKEDGKNNAGDDEDDHDIASVTVIRFDLVINKQLAAGENTTVAAGADVTYVVDVTNEGTVDAFDISIIDYVPSDMSLSPNDSGGWVDATGGVFNGIAGPLAPNETERLTITLRVDEGAALGTITNTVEIAAASDAPAGVPIADVDSVPDTTLGNDAGEDDASADGSVTIANFDLAMTKIYASDSSRDGLSTDGIVGVGENITFTIEVHNQGDVPAYDVKVLDRNPDGIFADDSSPTNVNNGWTINSPTESVVTIPGPINPQESVTVDIVLYVVGANSLLYAGDPTGNHDNLAEIQSAANVPGGPPLFDSDSTYDSDVTNDGTVTNDEIDGANGDADDHDSETFTVRESFDLAVIKYPAFPEDPRFSLPTIEPGDTITFEYLIENQGTVVAQNIELIEHVVAGLTLNDSDWTPNSVAGPGTATRTLTGINLQPGAQFTDTVSFLVGASVEAGMVFTNVIEILSATNGSGLTDVDSDSDNDPNNEIFIQDDYIRGNFRLDPLTIDEDDHDVTIFQTTPTQEVTVTKTLLTPGPIVQGQVISFAIRIENVGGMPILTLPLTDTYDTSYLTYDTILGATPTPDLPDADDGQLNWSNVTGNSLLAVGESLTVTVNFIAKEGTTALLDDTSCGNSSAGETVNVATALISTTNCVGVAIVPQASKSTLGDYVWYDKNGDGVKDVDEEGIDGVRVELYEVVDTGGGITETHFITFQLTGPDGLIDSDDTEPGESGAYDFIVADNKTYQVVITDTNFMPGAALEGYAYTGNNASNDYNGPDPRTVIIGTQDDHNDADFPFTLYSLGNFVFSDYWDNGVFDPADDWGLDGITVTLYADNGDGVFTSTVDTLISTTLTSGGGFYRFNELPAGDYIVVLPNTPQIVDDFETQFISSLANPINITSDPSPDPDNDVDNDDNGKQHALPDGSPGAIPSQVITLGGTEPVNDGDNDPYSNLTVDFGVWDPSLGDLVWLDTNANGEYEPGLGETGIPSVTLTLYRDNGTTPGVWDPSDGISRTLSTDADGRYYFQFVKPGPYFVRITPDNAAPGAPLDGLASTPIVERDPDTDNNEFIDQNGFPDGAGGYIGGLIIITNGGEPTDDGDTSQFTNLTYDFGFYQPAPSLALSKTLNGVNPFKVNETISFTIRITNTGNAVIDTLPLEDRYSSAFLTYASATISPTTEVNGILRWSDLLASDPDGLAVGETISLDVFFTTAADTTLVPAIAPCNQSGHTPNVARSVGAISGTTPVIEDADDKSCDSVQILNPTAVQLAERSVTQTSDGVLVRWSTVSESVIIGFNIWQSNGTEAEMRSREMIMATNAGQTSGASYQWLDEGATLSQGHAYMLEIVKNDGSTERTVIDVQTGGELFLPIVLK
ncbi:MAG: SdrD B-like domain-containing protein [Chloroflexota bacterium]